MKKSLNAIKHDNNTLMLMSNFVDAIDKEKVEEYPKYLKKLGLKSEEINELVEVEEYTLLFKPIFVLMAFKNGFNSTSKHFVSSIS